MRTNTYRLLTWLAAARPMAYASLIPDYGKDSSKPDEEIINRVNASSDLYPYSENYRDDPELIQKNADLARKNLPPIPGKYAKCIFLYATGPSGRTSQVIKLHYDTPDGLPNDVDMSVFEPEIAQYNLVNKDETILAQYIIDANKLESDRIIAVKASQDAAAAQSAAATAAANAADLQKRADFAAAEAQRQIAYQARLQQQIVDQASANAAVEAKRKSDIAMIDALNAKSAAENAASIASIKQQQAVATTKSANTTLLNGDISPGELKTGNSLAYLLAAGAAAYFIF